jgi:uncharacterized protein YjbI with pentapeptide repeats
VAIFTVIFVGAILSVVLIPGRLAQLDCNACSPDVRAKFVSDTRSAIVQLLLAIGGAITVFFTWRNYVRTSRDSETNLALAREARISDSFVKAVEQLGHESAAVRAGGAFGLGRLLQSADVEGDYWPIMDVLTSFVRGRCEPSNGVSDASRNSSVSSTSDSPSKLAPDVQAALNVLARRTARDIPERSEDSPVDLHGRDLSCAWMAGGHFERGFFSWSRLAGADLQSSKIANAEFVSADLSGANLAHADARESDFRGARLVGAQLDRADFSGSDFRNADFAGATLLGTNLKNAKLDGCTISDEQREQTKSLVERLRAAELAESASS